MTNEELAEIEARANAATVGPWYVDWSEDAVRDEHGLYIHIGRTPTHETHPNAPFIAHARTDVPKLIEEIRLLKIQIKDLEAKMDDMRW